jgi:hypothetical protein
MSKDPGNTPQSSLTLSYASVTSVFDMAMLAYDTYSGALGGSLTKLPSNQPVVESIETQLIDSGWKQIKDVAGQTTTLTPIRVLPSTKPRTV